MAKLTRMGEVDYRIGARERLEEAFVLLRQERFGGCVYLAGRAVEGMLRAVIWKSDPAYSTGQTTLDTGHDLREMLRLVRNLGVLRDHELRDAIVGDIQKIGRLWWNNMRFLPTVRISALWYDLGEVNRKRSMKRASQDYYDACSTVIRRCEALWHQ